MTNNTKYLKSFFGHLNTINRHRFLVCKLCFKVGLYRQGLTHDLSKYSLTEFIPGVRYFQGYRSPIVAEIQEHGYSDAWLHHKGRNRHHWQYWITTDRNSFKVIEMPVKYIKEMACDRIAACMVYEKDRYHPSSALEFLENSKERKFMPEKTLSLLTEMLKIVAENSLDDALEIIKTKY
ncbi:MAG: catalase [Erysipelotrichaceae bacterium]|nr:catalase [Erysipelotrichaceae bacterium]